MFPVCAQPSTWERMHLGRLASSRMLLSWMFEFLLGANKKTKTKKQKEGAWDEKQERIESMGPLLVVAARCVDAPEGTRGRTLKIQNY